MYAARAICFGTFDGFHEGHEAFLNQASALTDELIVLVARDEHIRLFKGREPRFGEAARLARVSQHPCVHVAVLSDLMPGTYHCLNAWTPDLILLGHDQFALLTDLLRHLRLTDSVVPFRFLHQLAHTPSKLLPIL